MNVEFAKTADGKAISVKGTAKLMILKKGEDARPLTEAENAQLAALDGKKSKELTQKDKDFLRTVSAVATYDCMGKRRQVLAVPRALKSLASTEGNIVMGKATYDLNGEVAERRFVCVFVAGIHLNAEDAAERYLGSSIVKTESVGSFSRQPIEEPVQ